MPHLSLTLSPGLRHLPPAAVPLYVPSLAFALSWAAGKRSSLELSRQERNPFPHHQVLHLLPWEEGSCAGRLVLALREVQGTTMSSGQHCG